jgi:hypothetical protein
MFPELMKSKDVLGDFAKTYEGMAAANADPFMKFNNSMDILKEKLGVIVLPLIISAIDEMNKPGGLIDVVGKFFEDLANPKTDAYKTFQDIKDAVGQVIDSVKTFFGYFGDGDAVKGFTNISKALIDALPALLALKGIMMLASGGKAIASLVSAITMIRGGSPTGGVPPAAGAINPITAIAVGSQAATYASSQLAQGTVDAGLKAKGLNVNITSATFTGAMALPYDANNPFILGGKRAVPNAPANNVVINVQGADPKATVDAISKYLKQNGSLPFIGKAGR